VLLLLLLLLLLLSQLVGRQQRAHCTRWLPLLVLVLLPW
jgi:hypothetical protein